MLLEAAGGLRVDPSQSHLVGDANTDIQAARVVGCRRYMVLAGRARRQLIHCWRWRKLDLR